jgi:hypothetical protein
MILASIQETKRHLESIRRFSMPGFRPEPEYVREMQRYGILPSDLSADESINVYETDRGYWQSFWHKPIGP